jgi:phospholipid/cholesterol/gamma-HCH transport system ATP-binding protein
LSAPGETDEVVIEVRGVRTVFGDHVVHDGVDLDVRRGEIIGLVGGSGSGKSVLLNEILGLIKPTDGTIRVFGRDISDLSSDEWKSMFRKRGVLFQSGALFSQLSVLENAKAPLRRHANLPNELMDEIARMKIAMVGLEPEAVLKQPSDLSGGMRKRAGLARALVMDPEILFLDEPTAGLDPIGAAEFDKLIKTLSETLNLTVLMVTHDLDSLFAVCDRVAVLADRKIVAVAPPRDLLENDHPWIHEYFHGPRGRAALTGMEPAVLRSDGAAVRG